MAKYILQPLVDFVTPIPLLECKLYSCGVEKTDIVLPHRMVSVKHCVFVVTPSGLQVLDLKSDNGTFINGKRIQECTPVDVKINDIIGIANDKIKNVSNDKPYVYRLELYDLKEEVGTKRKNGSGESSGEQNKIMKVDGNSCRINNGAGTSDVHESQVNMNMKNSDRQNEANAIEMDCSIPRVKEEPVSEGEETVIDEEEFENYKDRFLDEESTLNTSSVVNPNQTFANNERCMKKIQKDLKNKQDCVSSAHSNHSRMNQGLFSDKNSSDELLGLQNQQENIKPTCFEKKFKRTFSSIPTESLGMTNKSSGKSINFNPSTIRVIINSRASIFDKQYKANGAHQPKNSSNVNFDKPNKSLDSTGLETLDNLWTTRVKSYLPEYYSTNQNPKPVISESKADESQSVIGNSSSMMNEKFEKQDKDNQQLKTNDSDKLNVTDIFAGNNSEITSIADIPLPPPDGQQLYDPFECLNDEDFDEILNIDMETDIEINLSQNSSTETHQIAEKNSNSSLSDKTPEPSTSNTNCALELPFKFLSSIFKWNLIWFIKDNKGELDLSFKELQSAPYSLSYANYKDYYNDMEKLLLREVWACIIQKFNSKTEIPCRLRVICHKKSTIKTPSSKNYALAEFQVEIITSKLGNLLKVGDLVMLKLKTNWIFAYVKSFSTREQTKDTAYNTFCKSPIIYILVTQSLPSDSICTYRHGLQNIYHIGSFVRMVQAIECLKASPLLPIISPYTAQDILQIPEAPDYNEHNFITGDKLDDKQKETILRITNAIVKDKPKICFVDGPPGTGKSRIIVNIVTEIISIWKKNNERKRLLVCASSNAAIDSIALRLIKIRKKLERNNSPFKMVRAGSSQNSNVADISLNKVADRINKTDILLEADIILSKLSSCCSNEMELAFVKGLEKINACIIDEATLSCEPESLIPLMLGVKQLVLVGDSRELPVSFYSDTVKKYNHHKSLLSRVHEMFEMDEDNPIIDLNVQYRTADEIISWPNSYFRKSYLLTNVTVPDGWPFCSYKVFDHNSGENPDSYTMEALTEFVVELIKMIISSEINELENTIRIGVFVSNYHQEKIINSRWRKRSKTAGLENMKKAEIDFKKIDRIQGDEYDIIIMLSGDNSKQLGFLTTEEALHQIFTHVKYSLFVCGDFKLFKSDRTWDSLLQDARRRGLYETLNFEAIGESLNKIITKPNI